MDILLPARDFLVALKGFRPHAKGRAFQEPFVRATAGGSTLILLGSFENSVSLPAVVKSPGDVYLPLEATLKLLTTYKGKALIQVRSDQEFLWLGPVKLSLPKPGAKRTKAASLKADKTISPA